MTTTTTTTTTKTNDLAPAGAESIPPVELQNKVGSNTSTTREPKQGELEYLISPHRDWVERRKTERRHQQKSGRDSLFLRALAIFLILDVVLSFMGPIRFDRFDFPYKGWVWWTFNGLRDSAQSENIALMGSSLIVTATNYSDAAYLNKPLNIAMYHGAQYFDSLLEGKYGGSFKTYNLSTPGQIPSDAFMTLQAMLKTSHRPDVIIYGIAPRDFYDSSKATPMDSEPFQYLKRLVKLEGTVGKMFHSPWSKLSWLMEQNLYLYGNSIDLQLLCTRTVERVVDKLIPVPAGVQPLTCWQRQELLPTYKPAEVFPEAVEIQPEDPLHPPALKDDSKQYIERYRKPSAHNFRDQFFFLFKVAELCQREKIELILVNMPITEGNIKLLGARRYLEYIHALYRFSQEHNVPTFDLLDFNYFDARMNYHDSVHLNGSGGKKFYDRLVKILSSTPRTKAALELAGQKLQKQESLINEPTPTKFNIRLKDL